MCFVLNYATSPFRFVVNKLKLQRFFNWVNERQLIFGTIVFKSPWSGTAHFRSKIWANGFEKVTHYPLC